MDIQKRIEELMRDRGWSQRQLAKKSGLPQSTINSWARTNGKPSVESLVILCQAFGITMAEFFADGLEDPGISPQQRLLLEKWDCITPQGRTLLLQLMDMLMSSSKEGP